MNKEQWEKLSFEEKTEKVEQVLEKEVRPMLQMHAGGVQILDIKGTEVMIAYQGSCSGCFAATSGTLSFIEHMLQSHIFSEIKVVPIF